MNSPAPIILASGSPTRAGLLRNAGIEIEVIPAAIDEESIRDSFAAEGASALDCAVVLAETKAVRVSARHPGRLVIGADQILDLDGAWLEKPADLAAARRQLQTLRGRRHSLVSAAVIAVNGARIWSDSATAALAMREFTDAFLDQYLERAGAGVLASVGAYHYEGLGVQLFDAVDGDYFTILGLPLFPLLGFLRERGVIEP